MSRIETITALPTPRQGHVYSKLEAAAKAYGEAHGVFGEIGGWLKFVGSTGRNYGQGWYQYGKRALGFAIETVDGGYRISDLGWERIEEAKTDPAIQGALAKNAERLAEKKEREVRAAWAFGYEATREKLVEAEHLAEAGIAHETVDEISKKIADDETHEWLSGHFGYDDDEVAAFERGERAAFADYVERDEPEPEPESEAEPESEPETYWQVVVIETGAASGPGVEHTIESAERVAEYRNREAEREGMSLRYTIVETDEWHDYQTVPSHIVREWLAGLGRSTRISKISDALFRANADLVDSIAASEDLASSAALQGIVEFARYQLDEHRRAADKVEHDIDVTRADVERLSKTGLMMTERDVRAGDALARSTARFCESAMSTEWALRLLADAGFESPYPSLSLQDLARAIG